MRASVIAPFPVLLAENEVAQKSVPMVYSEAAEAVGVFILQNTETLHLRILQLSERVRQLEDGLHAFDPSNHLLSPELLQIKMSQHQSLSASPSASKDDSLRESVDALSLCVTSGPEAQVDGLKEDKGPPDVPPDVLQLSATFPFPWSVDLRIRSMIRGSLPARDDAARICKEARDNCLWQYTLDPSHTFYDNLLHHCYTSSIESLSPRRLALLLMVLSIGSLVDLNRPLGNEYGECYHHLARASVCEIPLMEEPDFDTLHALFFMIYYHLTFSDNNKAVGYAWNLMGFVAKLAQGLGLHREGSRLKLIPEEHEKRRYIFWALLNLDCRMSLSLGRPPSICLAHIDIKPPTFQTQGSYVPKEEILYHEWKNSFFIQCLSQILEAIIAPETPDYNVFITLDTRVRDFPVPQLLEKEDLNDVSSRFWAMQRALISTGRHIALLQLHRKHFMEAMNSSSFDLSHQFAPSVLATYLSCSSIISAVEMLFEREEQLSGRYLSFWFNVFSASVTLSLLVSRAPSCVLGSYVIADLERIRLLFVRAARILPFSAKTLPVIQKMTEKARRIFAEKCPQPHLDSLPSFQTHPSLPTSFLSTHKVLRQYLAQLQHSPIASTVPSVPPPTFSAQHTSNSYLPDIYHFNTAGIGIEERYHFATAPPTPFMPFSPRVDPEMVFHFDHGALATDLEETSYMAWF
ncbi:hypothetical protein VKT23_003837 [Stygiomarasmius scandens]|uniref:Xylanolytic transcriptional activator regulatory domain-containing protein n=1 Tax=Marasmiellus scandens TaxID=2682957 RepID=A0ABR1K182_9AGAR